MGPFANLHLRSQQGWSEPKTCGSRKHTRQSKAVFPNPWAATCKGIASKESREGCELSMLNPQGLRGVLEGSAVPCLKRQEKDYLV